MALVQQDPGTFEDLAPELACLPASFGQQELGLMLLPTHISKSVKLKMSNTCCCCGETSAGQFIWLLSLIRNLQHSWKDRVGVTDQQKADFAELMARLQAILRAGANAAEPLALSVCRACSKYTRLHHKWTDPKDRRTGRQSSGRCSRVAEPVTRLRTSNSAVDEWRWESRGQRNIAGQTHPRIYYTCKVPGCPARKTLDQNPDGTGGMLVRYYGGEHNHEPPNPESVTPGVPRRRKQYPVVEEWEATSETLSSRPAGSPGAGDTTPPAVTSARKKSRPSSLPADEVGGGSGDKAHDTPVADNPSSGFTTVNCLDPNGQAQLNGEKGMVFQYVTKCPTDYPVFDYTKPLDLEAISQPCRGGDGDVGNGPPNYDGSGGAAVADGADKTLIMTDGGYYTSAWPRPGINVIACKPTAPADSSKEPSGADAHAAPTLQLATGSSPANVATAAAIGPMAEAGPAMASAGTYPTLQIQSLPTVAASSAAALALDASKQQQTTAMPPVLMKSEVQWQPMTVMPPAMNHHHPTALPAGAAMYWMSAAPTSQAPPPAALPQPRQWQSMVPVSESQWTQQVVSVGDRWTPQATIATAAPTGPMQVWQAVPQAPPPVQGAPAASALTDNVDISNAQQVWLPHGFTTTTDGSLSASAAVATSAGMSTPPSAWQSAAGMTTGVPAGDAPPANSNTVVPWQGQSQILLNGQQWQIVQAAPVPMTPTTTTSTTAGQQMVSSSQPQWQPVSAPMPIQQWQAVQTLQTHVVPVGAPTEPQGQAVMMMQQRAGPMPVVPSTPQWIAAAPPSASGPQPHIVWMMPVQPQAPTATAWQPIA